MSSKKILMITQNFYPELGSAANRMKMLFKEFTMKGLDTQILTTQPSYPNHNLFKNRGFFNDELLNKLEGNKIIRMKMWGNKQHKNHFLRLIYYVEQFLRVRAYINLHKNEFDYIYVTSPNIFLAWATLFFKSSKKTKYILEIRDLWPDSVNAIKGFNLKLVWPLLKFLEKMMYHQADKIVINNEGFREHINSVISNNKPITYIPNSLNNSELLKEKKLKEFSVIYTGNIGYAQDVDELIEVCKKLNENQIHLTAIIYGVQAPKLRTAVKSMKYITVKKALNRHDCLKEISKHHVALSILNENEVFMNVMPGKIIDAIGVSTIPVTNIGGYLGQEIRKYKIGFAKKQASANEIVNAILNYKDDQKKYDSERQNVINYRDANLLWEKNIQKLLLFLKGE